MISNPSQSLGGGIAQLGERLNGIQEVCGSIPHTSTIVNSRGCGTFSTTPFFWSVLTGHARTNFAPAGNPSQQPIGTFTLFIIGNFTHRPA